MLLNDWCWVMILWPAQLIPDIVLDNAGILLGLLALLFTGLAILLFVLVSMYRRRKASGLGSAASTPAEMTAEAVAGSAVAESPSVEGAVAPPTATTPVLAKLFSPEGQPLESDFAQSNSLIPDDWAATEVPASDESGPEQMSAPDAAQLLAEVDARGHLEQVNQYVLLQYGELREEPGRVELSWYTTAGPRTISIATAADERELIVNGIPFDATSSGLQKGIVAYLRGSDNRSEPEAI